MDDILKIAFIGIVEIKKVVARINLINENIKI